MHRSDGQTGSQRSGVRRPSSLSLTWWGSGPPWKIRIPGSQTFPRATPPRPKTSTEVVVALAQPPDRPISQEVLQWTPQSRQCQRPPQQQRCRPQGQNQQEESVEAAAAAVALSEEKGIGAMEAGVWEVAVGTKLGGRPRPLRGLDHSLVPEPRTRIIVT